MTASLKGKYTFYSFPFRPFGISIVQRIIQDFTQFGDSFYSRKHKFSKLDLTIGIIKDNIFLSLNNRQLVHDFAERQKEGYYKKTGGAYFKSFKQFLGDGLLLSES
jgi:hypothetical protein